MQIKVPEPLFKQFRDKCDENFKKMSEVLRELMAEYSKDKNNE
jgi:hypothetical protein